MASSPQEVDKVLLRITSSVRTCQAFLGVHRWIPLNHNPHSIYLPGITIEVGLEVECIL